MIDQVDSKLVEWVASIDSKAKTRFDMPAEQPEGHGVVLYLLSFASTPPASTGRVSPLQFTLRYLITTWAESPQKAHKLLGDLALAAMEETAYEVELEPIPAETWSAFSIAPQPAFVLRTLLRKPRPQPAAKYVKKLVIDPRPGITFFGLVRGPEDIPVAHARIELRDDQRVAYTDAKGRFRFNNLPAGMPINLRVKAKGRVFEVSVEQPTSAENPFIIPFTLK